LDRALYLRLAERLDSIPNGFELTETGLTLLAKLFSPEEARLAGSMEAGFEAPGDIAARVGMDEPSVGSTLSEMARKGLIRSARTGEDRAYALMPFAVGVYEESLPRMDEELAALFEAYYQETRGGPMTHGRPALQRVIPVGESIPVDLEIFPYERAAEYIERARSWGVRDCICRVQQKLVGKGCDAPVENCLVFAPIEGAFEDSEATKPITRNEALRILKEAADAGLVHSTMNQQGQVFYICNCCTCCCGILRGVAEFGLPTAVARSDFQAVVDSERCTGCGACTERCSFGALSVEDDVCSVAPDRCVGCGVCVSGCSFDALRMQRRQEGEVPVPPANRRAWLNERAATRGAALGEAE